MPTPDTLRENSPATDVHPERFVVFAAVLFLSCLWAFVGYWAISSRQDAVDKTEQVMRRMDHAVGEQTRRLFVMIYVFLGAADQWIAENPGADPRTDRRFQTLLDTFRSRTGGAIDVQLVSEGGHVFPLSSAGDVTMPGIGDTDYFRAAMSGDVERFSIGTPTTRGPDGSWRIPVAHRLTQARKGLAALVATIDVQALVTLYEEQRIRPNGAIVLLRRDGIVLARAPHEEWLMGKSLVGGQLYREFLPRAERGFAKLDRTLTDSREKFVGYSMLGDFPLLTVVSTSVDDVFEHWHRQVTIIFSLAFCLTVATLLVAQRRSRLLRELSLRAAELEHLAATDLMTGTHSRHHFLELLYQEFVRARRYKTPLSVMVLDLDFFKQINDGYGHAAGDAALRMFASVTADCLRGVDVLGRLGGEEFGILLPSTDIERAQTVAERIRAAVAGIVIDTELGAVRFTTSIGVTQSKDIHESDESDESVDALLARADEALYAAKAAGRNRVVVRAP